MAKKGQLIQICISTLPDGANGYPAANFKFKATFTPGEVKEQEVVKKTAFTVTNAVWLQSTKKAE